MKFYTYESARVYCAITSQQTHRAHRVVKCRHWSMDDMDWRACWTVMLKGGPA